MANEHGDGTSAGQKAPDLLTVSQAAIVMQVGRTTAYALVSQFVESDGAEGIPAVVIGGQYRVPRTRLEELTGGPISWPPRREPRQRRHGAGRRAAGPNSSSAPMDGNEVEVAEEFRPERCEPASTEAPATDDAVALASEPRQACDPDADASTDHDLSADADPQGSQLSLPFEG
jgi:excisionase family DNA binding protein